MQIPICELETEKGGLEEKMMRSGLLLNTLERLGKTGYEVEEAQAEANKILKEAMIKLFALACRTERESRALEIAQLMPSHQPVQLCIKYAGKQRRIQLAEKLGELSSQKMDEEYEKQAAKDREEGLEMYSGSGIRRMQWNDAEEEEDEDESSQTQQTQEEESSTSDNPLLSAVQRRENTPKSLLASQERKNPFKKSSTPGSGARGINVIDSYRKAQKKAAAESSPSLKPVIRKNQNKQSTLKKNSDPMSSPKSADKENKTAPVKKQSALQLWLADNKEEIRTKFPDVAEHDHVGKAALLFRDLDDTVKQKYKSMAAETANVSNDVSAVIKTAISEISSSISKENYEISTKPEVNDTPTQEKSKVNPFKVLSNTNSEEEKKRKRDDNVEDSPADKKTKGSSGVSKLAAFAFSKDSQFEFH